MSVCIVPRRTRRAHGRTPRQRRLSAARHSDSDGDGNEYHPFLVVEPGDTGQRASEHTISRRYKSKEYAISRQKYKNETEYGTGGSTHARRTRRGPAAAAEHGSKTARGPEHSSRAYKTQTHRWTLSER